MSISMPHVQRNIAGARDPEVLSLFATAIEKLGDSVQQYVPRIMEAVFECTLLMITRNFEVIRCEIVLLLFVFLLVHGALQRLNWACVFFAGRFSRS